MKEGQVTLKSVLRDNTDANTHERGESARARPGGHATWASWDQRAEAHEFLSS